MNDERASADDRTLRAATALAAIEAIGLALLVVARNGGRTPLLALAVLAKVPFCLLARRRHAGAFLALVMWEVVGLVVALTAPRIAIAVRAAEAGLAIVVFGLLIASFNLFPSPTLPERE